MKQLLSLAIVAMVSSVGMSARAQCNLEPSREFEGVQFGSGFSFSAGPRTFCTFDVDAEGPLPPALIAGGTFTSSSGTSTPGVAWWDGSVFRPLPPIPFATSVTVNALAVFDEDGPGPLPAMLFAGGRFLDAPNNTLHLVVAFDGTSWRSVGTAAPGFNSATMVNALVVGDPDGEGGQPIQLAAAGNFGSIAGVLVNSIALWNGTTWSSIGAGLTTTAGTPSTVNTMVYADVDGVGPAGVKLVAGGTFTRTGTTTLSRLSSWDGSTWTNVGTGLGSAPSAMTVYDPDGDGPQPPNFVVAGAISVFGTVTASRIARWDGQQWIAFGSGLGGGSPALPVLALAVFDADGPGGNLPKLFAAGSFETAGGLVVQGVAGWDGANWFPMGVGLNDTIPTSFTTPFGRALIALDAAFTAGRGNLLAIGGSFLTIDGLGDGGFAFWNGSAWLPPVHSVAGQPFYLDDVQVNSLCAWDRDGEGPLAPILVVAGRYQSADGLRARSIAGWGPDGWQTFGIGVNLAGSNSVPGVFDVTSWDEDGDGPNPPLLVAAGGFTSMSGVPAAGIAKWNGSSWSAFVATSSPVSFSDVVSCDHDGSASQPPTLYAIGAITAGSSVQAVYRWIGSDWQRISLAAPFNPQTPQKLMSFSTDPAHRVPELLVALDNTNGLLSWDGGQWSPMASVSPGACMTVFDVDGAGPQPARVFVGENSRIAYVEGGQTITVPGFPLNVNPKSMCSFDDDGPGPHPPRLCIGTDNSNGVYRWDADGWHLIATTTVLSSSNATTFQMTSFDDDAAGPRPPSLFLGGYFNLVQGQSSVRVARLSLPGLAPSIVQEPVGSTAREGNVAEFEVVAQGSEPLTYQWRRDGVNLQDGPAFSGSQTSHLVAHNVRPQDSGQYTVVVSNPCGSASSASATLVVYCLTDVDGGFGNGQPDGGTTIDDLLYYLAIFEAGDSSADVDDGSATGTRDGGLTIDDLLYYLQRFEVGC